MPRLQSTLASLAQSAGIQMSYYSAFKRRVNTQRETLLHILRALGYPIEHAEEAEKLLQAQAHAQRQRMIEPVIVAWQGNCEILIQCPSVKPKSIELDLVLEDGVETTKTISLSSLAKGYRFPKTLPFGYHTVTVNSAGRLARALIISAPRAAFFSAPDAAKRHWGIFAPLYAIRSQDNFGAGNISDFRQLAAWVASHGGTLMGTLPLLATYLEHPVEPSPYSPISRLFWNEFYIDPRTLPEFADCQPARALLNQANIIHELSVLRKAPLVDYQRQMALKRRVLIALSRHLFNSAASDRLREFHAFVDHTPALHEYARFRSLVSKSGPDDASVHLDLIDESRYHLYVQWALHRQLSSLSQEMRNRGQSLYLDFPLGVHSQGFDVWQYPDIFASSSAGAPPDSFFTKGQNWGFPPFHPQRIRDTHYRYFIESIRNHLRYAGMLRIDHIMGLHRLYWIPQGAAASEGAYVRYHRDEFYAIVCLESHRHRVPIIGENLGTVPDYVNKTLNRHHIGKMYTLQYQVDLSGKRLLPPDENVLASLNTHDMPPFYAFWKGMTNELRIAFAHLIGGHLFDGPHALLQSLSYLAGSKAHYLIISLEDLWLEADAQNIPGTSSEHPNWQRKFRFDLYEITHSEALTQILTIINAKRQVLSPHHHARFPANR